MYGKDFAYAHTRITGSIVRLAKSGEPVYVEGVLNNGTCVVSDIRKMQDGEPTHVHLDDLNVEPVRLGYVNVAGQAVYLMRVPIRKGPGNQGLRSENSVCSNGQRLLQLPMDALYNCIVGKYPTYIKALAGVGKNKGVVVKTIAFSRHWAISGSALMYKNRCVGSCADGKPVLDESHQYLRESLGELL